MMIGYQKFVSAAKNVYTVNMVVLYKYIVYTHNELLISF